MKGIKKGNGLEKKMVRLKRIHKKEMKALKNVILRPLISNHINGDGMIFNFLFVLILFLELI
jgi:hypothetical protein